MMTTHNQLSLQFCFNHVQHTILLQWCWIYYMVESIIRMSVTSDVSKRLYIQLSGAGRVVSYLSSSYLASLQSQQLVSKPTSILDNYYYNHLCLRHLFL